VSQTFRQQEMCVNTQNVWVSMATNRYYLVLDPRIGQGGYDVEMAQAACQLEAAIGATYA